jgi:predicted metal-binding protein
MSSNHTLFVCTTCAKVSEVDPSGGQQLLEQLMQLAQTWELEPQFSIQPVKCMFVCEKSCAISLTANGKYTYLFGHLNARDSATAILDCAEHYYRHPDGLLPYSSRPEPLKTTVLARIPPQPISQPA